MPSTARRHLPRNETEISSSIDRLVPHFSNVLMFNLVLAVQNMEASGVIAKTQEIEFKALEGSLSMMSKGRLLFACQSVQYCLTAFDC